MKAAKEEAGMGFPIILKSGATDLRRHESKLVELVKHNYQDGIKPGVTYGFSNKNKTAIKLLAVNPDASVSIVKLKREKPYVWPEYQEKGKEGYVVELEGEKKQAFLNEIGYPSNP
jgi:hypothetical protein